MIFETFTSSSPDLSVGVSALSMAAYALMGACGKVRVGVTSAIPYYYALQAIDRIDEIAELRDGWSGEGSLAPTERIILAARTIAVGLLAERPGAEIAAMPNGTIAFDWETADGSANLEIGETAYSFYLDLAEGRGFMPLSGLMGYLSLPDINHYLGLLMPNVGLLHQRTSHTTYSFGVERLAYA